MSLTALKLLAIETSSQTGSVAIGIGETVVERTIASAREQTATVLAHADDLLTEADLALAELDAIVFGRGPGSFTGLRIAAAVAQGLSLASGKPILPVSSLAALAQRGLSGRVRQDSAASRGETRSLGAQPASALCCVDARMGEVYTGCYRFESGLVVAAAPEAIGKPEAVRRPDGPFLALGDGWAAYADALGGVLSAALAADDDLVPRARDLLPLAAPDVRAGRFPALEAALPVYLREADAWRRA